MKLLFCSLGKELHPAHGNCTCYTDDEDVHCSFPRKNLGQLLFYSVQSSKKKSIPFNMQSLLTPPPPPPPPVHFSTGQFQIERHPEDPSAGN
jgi:hypothetical protein